MPRPPGVYWHKGAGAWATNAGVRENGKRKTIYFRGIAKTDKRSATVALKDYLDSREQLAQESVSPSTRTVCELYVRHSERSVKPRTTEGHIEILSRFAEFVPSGSDTPYGDRPASGIRAADLSRMARSWEDAGYAPSYRSRLVRTVKAAWAWAATPDPYRSPEILIPDNPLKNVKGVRVPQSPERYATRKEVADFLRFAWRRAEVATPLYRKFGRLLVLMIRTAARTGARPGELCSARWEDFDPVRRTITLTPDRHKTGEKTGKTRVVRVPRSVVSAIERTRGQNHPIWIFTHKRGKGSAAQGAEASQGTPWDSKALAHAIRRIRTEAIKAGLNLKDEGPNAFVAYRLRHTYISDAIMDGVPTSVTAALTGTSERMIATTYGHVINSRLDAAAEFLDTGRKQKQKPPE